MSNNPKSKRFNGMKLHYWLNLRRWRRLRLGIFYSLGILLGGWLLIVILKLSLNASKPLDAFFILGGSISREIYAAQLAKQHPEVPILISSGSLEPCIKIIFQRAEAFSEKVWLESCADSTFGNFYYGIPILKQWGVHKVGLITSGSHLRRAMGMARIQLGAHGIWVEPKIVPEQGVPGNQESSLKTILDLTRSLLWSIPAQFIQPQCSRMIRLTDVDMALWHQQGFKCEHQGGID